jgi:nucleoid DNA-binding protein
MNKDKFIRLLAERSGLTIIDTKAVWTEVEKLFSECVENREELHLKGIGHLIYMSKKMPKTHYDIVQEKVVDSDKERVSFALFTLSRNLKDLMIEDVSKRRLVQTRQAELRRKGLLENVGEGSEEDIEDCELEDDEFNEED